MALEWANPWFFYVAALALAPLLIQLLGRKRIQQVAFGAFRFLRKHAERVVRQHRLLEALLVLLRCAAIAALVLAFAHPFLRSSQAKAGAEGGKEAAADSVIVLLVDASYSMRAPGLMAEAKRKAQEILDDLPQGTAVALGLFHTRMELKAEPADDRKAAGEALAKIEPTTLGTDLNRVLAQTDTLLRGSPFVYRKIVVVSDAHRSAWDRKENLRLSPGVQLEVHAVGEGAVDDVCVRRVVVPPVVLAGGFEQEILAEVANLSGKERSGLKVQFSLDGKAQDSRSVNLPAQASTLVRFRHLFTQAGDVAGRVEIEGGGNWTENDAAAFVIPVLPRVQVLLVNGDSDSNPAKDDGFYLSRALHPDPSSPISVRNMAAEKFAADALKDVDVVALANVGRLDARAAQALDEFVQHGGGIAIFPGKKVTPEAFNAELAQVSPCRLRQTEEPGPGQTLAFGEVDYKHDMLKEFEGPHQGNFATARFLRYFSVTDSQSARVVMRFTDGAPAVLVKEIGKGRSAMLTTPVDLEWNDFCLKAVFLPFVQEMTRWLCREKVQTSQNRIAGQAIRYEAGAEVKEAQVTTPSGETRKLEARPAVTSSDLTGEKDASAGAEASIVEFTPEDCGLYTLVCGSVSRPFAVQPPGEELETERFDPRELTTAVLAPASELGEGGGEGTEDGRTPKKRPLWAYALGALLSVLGAEMLLAVYLSKR